MYEEIEAAKEKPNNARLWAVIALCAAVFVVITALIVGMYMYYVGFRGFISDFSEITNLNYRKGGVTATTAEGKFELSQENIYDLYNDIIYAGRGRPGEKPEREPDALLEYKFGGKLELWEVELKGGSSVRDRGLFICFTNRAGEVYAYDTDQITLDRLPLGKWQNE